MPDTFAAVMMTFRLWIKFLKRRFGSSFAPPEVPVLHIEVTNVCTGRCVFCPNQVMKRPRQHLDMELFKKAVAEFAAMGGAKVNFCTCIGEPLLDPRILERARYLKQFPQFKSLGFFTTLQWLHNFDIDEFLGSGITWVVISTMLTGRQEYREFFGVDNYEQTLKNIIKLIEENNKRKNKIEVIFSLKPSRLSKKDAFRHPDFKLVESLIPGGITAQQKDWSPCVDDWGGAVKLPAHLHKFFYYPRVFSPCRLLYENLIVFSNGKVGACACRDFEADSELVLGDIRSDSLQAMWQGERLAALRNDWRRKNIIPAICKRCGF